MEVIGAGFGDQVHVADSRKLGGVVHGYNRDLLRIQYVVQLVHRIVVRVAILTLLHLVRAVAGPL